MGALLSIYVLQPRTALACVAYTIASATLMLTSPHLKRAIDWTLDRLVLKRPDYLAAASAFEASLRRLSDDNNVTAQLIDAVRDTLRLDSHVRPAAAAQASNVLVSLPIATVSSAPLHLEISNHQHGRRLLQQELEYLRTITAHVSHRLEALQLEREQRVLLIREERLKRLLSEAELKALRTQVDPHFLFNTLNTIADLITTQPAQAEQMIERLAECFRYALAKHSLPLSTLSDELDFARQYLSIEQVRFGERLRVQLSRGNTRGDETVPSLLLQPLLENAIKHGLATLRDGGCVSVQAHLESDHLRLQVEDDGVGICRDAMHRGGVGLRNVRQRLDALYSQAATMMVDPGATGRGTTVTIRVPLHEH
jgi:two-component system LytT family sensor kinase